MAIQFGEREITDEIGRGSVGPGSRGERWNQRRRVLGEAGWRWREQKLIRDINLTTVRLDGISPASVISSKMDIERDHGGRTGAVRVTVAERGPSSAEQGGQWWR